MLQVSYLRTFGYVMLRGTDNKLYKCKMHPANCLYATCYHHKNHTVELIDFFSDTKHLERCLKNNIFQQYEKIVIYTNTDFREKYKVAQLFTKYGYNVEMKACKRWKRNVKK